jgi:hypothetical protein
MEHLSLSTSAEEGTAVEWQDGAVDGAIWRELLGPVTGARILRIGHAFA